jgi:putative monooxygenase
MSEERPPTVRLSDIEPNRRRGGDLRVLLGPKTVGATTGFMGALTLQPGEVVAEHYHPYSEEYLFVASGELRVDLDGEETVVGTEQAILIPRNVRHRLVNTGTTPVLAVFQLSPLAPRPELGHVDTEAGPAPAEHATVGSR